MIRRYLSVAFPLGILLCLLASCATKPCGFTLGVPSLVGTWRLVSVESRAEDGEVRETYGANPVGLLMYGDDGRMSVHLMRRDRPGFASADSRGGTAEEVKAAFDSHVSYFGTYEINATEGMVSHHIEGCSYPNWSGTTQKRFLKLEGNRLSLSTPPIRTDGKDFRVFLVWERFE